MAALEAKEPMLSRGPVDYDPVLAARLMLEAVDGIYKVVRDASDPNEVYKAGPPMENGTGAEVTASLKKDTGELTVIFRGSHTLSDWLLDFNFCSCNADEAVKMSSDGDKGIAVLGNPDHFALAAGDIFGTTVHTSFHRAALTSIKYLFTCGSDKTKLAHRGAMSRAIKYSLWVEEVVRSAFPDAEEPMKCVTTLNLAGHSLGGAAAQAFAFWCASNHEHITIQCYTWESLLLGNYALQKAMIAKVPLSFGHRVNFDPVPLLLPWRYSGTRHHLTWTLEYGGLLSLAWPNIKAVHGGMPRLMTPWMKHAYGASKYQDAWHRVRHVSVKKTGSYNKATRSFTKENVENAFPHYAPNFTGDADHLANLVFGEDFTASWTDRAESPYPACLRAVVTVLQVVWFITAFACLGSLCYLVFGLFRTRDMTLECPDKDRPIWPFIRALGELVKQLFVHDALFLWGAPLVFLGIKAVLCILCGVLYKFDFSAKPSIASGTSLDA